MIQKQTVYVIENDGGDYSLHFWNEGDYEWDFSGPLKEVKNAYILTDEQMKEVKTVIENLMEQYRFAVNAQNEHLGAAPCDWDNSDLPSYEAAKELLSQLNK